jgi:hypothetical protein
MAWFAADRILDPTLRAPDLFDVCIAFSRLTAVTGWMIRRAGPRR